jgi:hypothetical protein
MHLKTTVRATAAALVAGATLAGVAQAKFEDGSAASHYTPRALKALGQQWEAKATFYGKRSLSLQKKRQAPAPAQTPISTSPPEGIELPGDTSPPAAVPPSCAYTHDEPC